MIATFSFNGALWGFDGVVAFFFRGMQEAAARGESAL
jgi:hypothetical protein